MTGTFARVLTVVTIVGSGLVAGVFFAFSTFVMRALGRLRAPTGLEAMQSINLAAPTPLFMAALFGTALTGATLAVVALVDRAGTASTLALLGGLAALVPGLVTIGFHVPRNDALAGLDPGAAQAADQWSRYQREWTAGNHVRTLGGMVATLLLTLSLIS